MSKFLLMPLLTVDVKPLAMLMAAIVISSFAYVGCTKHSTNTNYLECRFAETTPGSGLTEMVFEPTGEKYYLYPQVEFTEQDITKARVVQQNSTPVIELNFTSEGSEKLAEVTAANIGKYLAMVVDGKLMSAPLIRAQIPGGRALIVGKFTEAQATQIAENINIGLRKINMN